MRVKSGPVIFAILLCALATGSSEGKRKAGHELLGNGGASSPPQTSSYTTEQAWIDCENELMARAEVIQDFDIYVLREAIHGLRSIKGNMDRASRILPPDVKRMLLDCLRENNLRARTSNGEPNTRNWFMECMEFLFYGPNIPRRNLVSRSHHQITSTNILASAPSTSPRKNIVPSPAPTPSPNQNVAISPSPYSATESPSTSPAPTNLAPTISPSPKPQALVESPEEPSLPPDTSESREQPPTSEILPIRTHVAPSHTPKKDDHKWMKSAIAAGCTAAGTLFVVALILLCCSKGRNKKVDPRAGQKDDRPLLNLSLSDFSAGSSQKSYSVGNSSGKQLSSNSGKTPSLASHLSIVSNHHDSSQPEVSSLETTGVVPLPPLKPPPGKSVQSPPGPPPPPLLNPRPPPPPKGGRPPPLPPKGASPLRPNQQDDHDAESDAPKTKLKPFFWDKVLANSDQTMVWHEIKSGSFQFNEEMMESLFGYSTVDKNKTGRRKEPLSLETPQYIQIIDTKKAQNLSILLRALNVTTEEVCDALQEGTQLPVELLQTLVKMAPTAAEELKLRLFSGEMSQLGPAERFLKVLVDIPHAFKRVETLLFMNSAQEEVSSIKESLTTLEVACGKLRDSRLFLKLLEAVLKTGNRMNDGTYRGGAQAFKLDTLLKLSDVRGKDGKTTLLHFVVQEIIRSEGIRAARSASESQSMSSVRSEDLMDDSNHDSAEHYSALGLQVVSGVSNELKDVKKAAVIDADGLSASVAKLEVSLAKTKRFLNTEMESMEEESKFRDSLTSFVECIEGDVAWILEEEKRIMALVESTAAYFHGSTGKSEGLRLFVIVRDFLIMLDKACKEVRDSGMKTVKTSRTETPTASPSRENHQPSPDIRQRLFPAILDRQMYDSSSDDESPSP
ncbi:formin-like protein 3 [Syzygium oleosum]|uniref:formin-like protein 3 n=1 Tax=Syzygium oleosum TaxID=219896 RepID=UPI0011D1F608|nr:formin-like protein 3 [Syzygium oleosum]